MQNSKWFDDRITKNIRRFFLYSIVTGILKLWKVQLAFAALIGVGCLMLPFLFFVP